MAIAQETSYRDDPNDRSDESLEVEESPYTPATAFFKLPLKLLTILISFFSASIFGLALGSYILIQVSSLERAWSAEDALRDLAITLGVNFLVTTPAIFFQLPVIILAVVDITMSTVILVFAPLLLSDGWPSSDFCSRRRYIYDEDSNGYSRGRWEELPETSQCRDVRHNLRIMMGVAGGVGILIAVLILISLVLRIVAIARTKFWEKVSFWEKNRLPGQIALPTKRVNVTWRPAYKVQFSMTFLKEEQEEAEAAKVVEPSAVGNTKVQDGADNAATATLI